MKTRKATRAKRSPSEEQVALRAAIRAMGPGGSSSRYSSPIMPLAPGRPPVPLIYHAPSDVQESCPGQGVHASHLRASYLSTRRRGPGEPVPLSFPARLQAGLRGDTARVPDAPAHREGEDAAGKRESQRYRSLLRGWLLQPGSFSNLFAYRVGLSPSEYRSYACSTISVPSKVRALFVPSCFFTMFEERGSYFTAVE